MILNDLFAVIIYVNPKCDCGKHIISYKFHKSHTKFGPGQVHSVYKSILQSFVDCANNRQEVFKMIPTGKSNEYVRRKNSWKIVCFFINQVRF